MESQEKRNIHNAALVLIKNMLIAEILEAEMLENHDLKVALERVLVKLKTLYNQTSLIDSFIS